MRKGLFLLCISFCLVGCTLLPVHEVSSWETVIASVPTRTPTIALTETSTLVPTPTITLTPTPTATKIWTPEDFPYVSQMKEGALKYEADCASAVVLMIAKYYGVSDNETVDEIHKELAGGEWSVDWLHLRDYFEDVYGLSTKVVVTDSILKDALKERYKDLSDIYVVEDIPHDTPVAWIYAQTPHWIVRYNNYSFDPNHYLGIRLFEDTENIYKPERGLGIIVTK